MKLRISTSCLCNSTFNIWFYYISLVFLAFFAKKSLLSPKNYFEFTFFQHGMIVFHMIYILVLELWGLVNKYINGGIFPVSSNFTYVNQLTSSIRNLSHVSEFLPTTLILRLEDIITKIEIIDYVHYAT